MEFPRPFGKYTLLKRLAFGGMAEIFLAEARGPAGFVKQVAIKRILPQFAQEREFVAMFLDEARLAAKLTHANIVQIFDFAEREGNFYLAMEYVDGPDLRRVLQAGRERNRLLPPGLAAWCAMEVAKGLDYAHRKTDDGRPLNIIHRDINPHNILVSYEGAVKIADFGIARAAERRCLTESGVIKGKLPYLSPEQLQGAEIDPRSDLFALGAVLYELLTGERIFQGRTDAECLERVLRAPVAPPAAVRDGIPASLSWLNMKLLSRDRRVRPPDAATVVQEITRLLGELDQAEQARMGAYVGEVYPPGERDEDSRRVSQLQTGPAVAGAVSSYARTTAASSPAPVPLRRKLSRIFAAAGAFMLLLAALAALVRFGPSFRGPDARGVPAGEPPDPRPAAVQRDSPAPVLLPAPVAAPALAAPAAPALAAPAAPALAAPAAPAARPVTETGMPARVPPRKSVAPGRAGRAQKILAARPRTARDPAPRPPPDAAGPPAPAESLTGEIRVAVAPWAQVFLDGRDRGDNPVQTFRVRSGRHSVRLVNREYHYDRTFHFDLLPGMTKRIIEELKKP